MDRRTALVCLALAPVAADAIAAEAPFDLWRSAVLTGPDGKGTSLAAHAGSGRLVVVTMKGHWCPVCLGELAHLASVRDRLGALKTRVVGVNADTYRANAEAARHVGIPWPILSDPQHRVLDALNLWLPDAGMPMPGIVVFDECGKERGRFVWRRPGQSDEKPVIALLEKIAAAPPRCSEANA